VAAVGGILDRLGKDKATDGQPSSIDVVLKGLTLLLLAHRGRFRNVVMPEIEF